MTGEKIILMALFLVLAMLPVDIAIIYGLSSSYYKRTRQFLTNLIKLLEPEAYGILRHAGYTLISAKRKTGEIVYMLIPDNTRLYLVIVKEFVPRQEKNAKSIIELASLSLHLSKKIGTVRKFFKLNKPTRKEATSNFASLLRWRRLTMKRSDRCAGTLNHWNKKRGTRNITNGVKTGTIRISSGQMEVSFKI